MKLYLYTVTCYRPWAPDNKIQCNKSIWEHNEKNNKMRRIWASWIRGGKNHNKCETWGTDLKRNIKHFTAGKLKPISEKEAFLYIL